MNKFKKIIITAISLLMTFICTISFVGCGKDIREVDIKVSLYDFSNSKYEDYSLDIELYGHLAPETVSQISKLIKSGYYNDTVFYKIQGLDDQIMLGDLKYDPNSEDATIQENCGFYLNDEKPTIKGEFKHGGTTGSNLKNKVGSIGLWRTWTAQDSNYDEGSTGMDTGSATWFIPTATKSAYDDYFCVFAQYDYDGENKETIDSIKDFFSSSLRYQDFVIYYTGEYGDLTFHCAKAEDFEARKDEIVDLFEAEEGSSQLVRYNHYTIRVPMTTDGRVAARIVKANMK